MYVQKSGEPRHEMLAWREPRRIFAVVDGNAPLNFLHDACLSAASPLSSFCTAARVVHEVSSHLWRPTLNRRRRRRPEAQSRILPPPVGSPSPSHPRLRPPTTRLPQETSSRSPGTSPTSSPHQHISPFPPSATTATRILSARRTASFLATQPPSLGTSTHTSKPIRVLHSPKTPTR